MRKKIKALLSLYLTLCLVLSLITVLGVSVAADGNTCKILETGTEYATVQQGIDAATAGQTVQLLTDETVTSTVMITSAKAGIILDLNGHTLDGSGIPETSEKRHTVSVNAAVTIKSSAEAKGTIKGGRALLQLINEKEYLFGGNIVSYTSLTMSNVTVTGGSEATYGGGIYVRGNLAAENCIFSNNTAKFGSGIYVENGGTLTLNKCEIIENTASSSGGAISCYTCNTVLNECKISGNTGSLAGAIFAKDGTLTAVNCTFSENTAKSGGVLYSTNTNVLNATGCTFTKNKSTGSGAVFNGTTKTAATFDSCTVSENTSDLYGTFYYTGTLTLKNTKVTGNKSAKFAGVYNFAGKTFIYDSEISGNTSDSAEFGCGICNYNDAELTVGGKTVIYGNKVNEKESNIFSYKEEGKDLLATFTVSAETPLTEGSKIGIDSNFAAAGLTVVANVSATDAQYFVSDKENYTLQYDTEAKVLKYIADIGICTVDAIADQAYTGSAITPEITVKNGETPLASGTDYTVAYTENTVAGTATVTITGAGNYNGTKTVTFNITGKDVSESSTVEEIADVTYTGEEIKPVITLKDGDVTLVEGTDYTVAYSDNTAVGTGKITITFKGNYTGTKEVTFNIKASPATGDNAIIVYAVLLLASLGAFACVKKAKHDN